MGKTPVGDRQRLEHAAAEFSSRLRAQIGKGLLKFESSRAEKTDSGGWSVVMATMGSQLPSLQLWLDRWAKRSELNFWFGFGASSPALINEVIKFCPLPIGLHIADGDATTREGIHSLTKPLSEADATYPLHESYLNNDEFYFGIHDLGEQSADRGLNFDRAINFFVQVIHSLPDFRDAYELDRDLEGMPVGRRRREYRRSISLAREFISQRIAAQNLICDDCRFDPSDRIGGLAIHPRSLLDIHHRNPLAHGKRQTELCDLSLLCPTCHRLTHARTRIEQALT